MDWSENTKVGEHMEIDIDLSILEVEPAEEYHAKAREYLSSHQLMDFAKCPWLHRKKSLGLIEDTESPAYRLGRAAHVRILEGKEVYRDTYALGGPINPADSETVRIKHQGVYRMGSCAG